MKVKSVLETVGPFTKEHNYLGHFKNENVLNQGHNDGPSITERLFGKKESLYEKTERQAAERAAASPPPPATPVVPGDESKRRKQLDKLIEGQGG